MFLLFQVDGGGVASSRCELHFRVNFLAPGFRDLGTLQNNSWIVNPLPVVRCRNLRLSLNWKQQQQQSMEKPQQLLSLCY